jgi:2-oxoglutarate ferredoxin oxidoreductase subunit alpha
VRLGSQPVTNMGDEADLVVALNEQVLYGRIQNAAYREGTVILLESKWAEDPDQAIRAMYAEAVAEFRAQGLVVRELPFEQACLAHTDNPRVGKNMFVLGLLCEICGRDAELALNEISTVFKKKGEKVIALNQALFNAGVAFADEHVDLRYEVPAAESRGELLVLNGNQAVGLGVMAAGIEVVSMYPITPATSASHYISGVFENVGGIVHQAEDEIAAIGFAIGCSYAGKTACTITSGPGMALKSEFIGLASMGEVPLVIVDVQRGGPSTGLPTKIEQGDLLMAMHQTPGDAPKAVMAAATIDECLSMVVTARTIAEAFRMPVVVLTDANLATGVAPIPRPRLREEWLSPEIDQSVWEDGVPPYAWDPETGLSARPIPGQRGGEYVLTGLAHTDRSKVAYDPRSNQHGCEMRSRKLAALRSTLRPPVVNGDEEGDLLVVGWGSTLGAIEEAVERLRAEGQKVSSLHIRYLLPMQPGLKETFERFRRVMTIEINYSDPREGFGDQPGRASQLARALREETLMDIDHWSVTWGQPLRPGQIETVIRGRLEAMGAGSEMAAGVGG